MEKSRILIIEDEKAIADLLAYALNKEGFHTMAVNTGSDGLREIETFNPQLLLLDWMLPDMSGLDICRKVTAAQNLPIIMITARSDITDKIVGLEFGVDDYITKPFDMREVVARIRNILRRIQQLDQTLEEGPDVRIQLGDIEIRLEERLIRKNHVTVELTPKEFDLLITLYKFKGKVFTRAELLDVVWGYDYAGDTRTVDIHVQRLRKKLDLNAWITTVFGVGYKFEKQVDESHVFND
ncbi:response regulator transcription factor [Paenibacillus oryzisoli]|uniref:DNA-binding response regulator n=1 Tax=Paenibacillus oryzisoli TaxID=1850517 RepID=A0A198A0X7_9BACL|nr:response regulator transcription factor [Paenibacillus oryzisoli]OAS14835.1 DNA-binding response regulator [Paenibacillus oryzisoli]